jgi:hypothetical protein
MQPLYLGGHKRSQDFDLVHVSESRHTVPDLGHTSMCERRTVTKFQVMAGRHYLSHGLTGSRKHCILCVPDPFGRLSWRDHLHNFRRAGGDRLASFWNSLAATLRACPAESRISTGGCDGGSKVGKQHALHVSPNLRTSRSGVWGKAPMVGRRREPIQVTYAWMSSVAREQMA